MITSLNNTCIELAKKINECFRNVKKEMRKFSSRIFKNKTNLGTLYFNGKEIGYVNITELNLEYKKNIEENITKLNSFAHGEYEGTFKMKISPHIIKKVNRTIENRRLFNILRKTRKKRTKKKLAKRIIRNYVLNKLDKY